MNQTDPILERALTLLAQQTATLRRRQIDLDGSPHDGGFIYPAIAPGARLESTYGRPMADANHAYALATLGYALVIERSPRRGDGELLGDLLRAVAFLRRGQRDSGLIDLPSTNYESPPDTAFAVQVLCPVLAEARRQALAGFDPAGQLDAALTPFIDSAARGIVGRGFHTPNHRWVIGSALTQAMTLVPALEPEARPYIEAMLAETIDVNADGQYTERSTGVYDAIVNRSLRFMAGGLNRPELLEPVRKNLDLLVHLLDHDACVLTGLSIRQDRGQDVVPVNSVDSLIDLAHRDGNTTFAAVADELLARSTGNPVAPQLAAWLIQPFVANPDYRTQPAARGELPQRYDRIFRAAQIWRVREPELSTTVAGGTRRFFAFKHGRAHLRAVKLFGAYINEARFAPSHFEPGEGWVRLTHRGVPPVYVLPLGRPIADATWSQTAAERQRWEQPAMDIVVEVQRVEDGFDLHVRTHGGLANVLFQIECCFDGPGEWETPDQVAFVDAGQTVILKQGHGLFQAGDHGIRIGPGAAAHRTWQMRNSEPEEGSFRVLIPLQTPVDHVLQVRAIPPEQLYRRRLTTLRDA